MKAGVGVDCAVDGDYIVASSGGREVDGVDGLVPVGGDNLAVGATSDCTGRPLARDYLYIRQRSIRASGCESFCGD